MAIFRKNFSGDDKFIVAFRDDPHEDGVFNKKAIELILHLTDKFEQIEGIDDVSSLTNYQYMSATDNEFSVDDFITDYSNLAQKKSLALRDELILNQLISHDGTTTAVAVKLSEDIGSNEEVNIYVFNELIKITSELEKSTGYKFYISGPPAITASLVNVSQRDAKVLIPLAVVVVIVLLFLIFRSYMGVLIPSVIIVFTFLTVLSIQMLLGYKLNNFTVNIPSFVSAIAIADSMHLYLAWMLFKMRGLTNRESVENALRYNLLPIALTSLTTAVGFASLGLSEIEPISTLGVAVTSAAICSSQF